MAWFDPSWRGDPVCITGSVGTQGKNDAADVKVVQVLLNANAERFAGGRQLLVDGVYGPKTAAAMRAFQATVVGTVDAQVSPGHPTLLCMVEGLQPELGMPHVQAIMAHSPVELVERYADLLPVQMELHAINTRLRCAHFLAQVAHESGGLRYTEELASGEAYEGRADLGNDQPGDGVRFKGRGLIQLTGRANYRAYGEARGRDFLEGDNPTLLASDPELAVDVAGWFWATRGLNEPADRDDLRLITRRINGGYNGLADREAHLAQAKWFLC
jgi:putative chitinase